MTEKFKHIATRVLFIILVIAFLGLGVARVHFHDTTESAKHNLLISSVLAITLIFWGGVVYESRSGPKRLGNFIFQLVAFIFTLIMLHVIIIYG